MHFVSESCVIHVQWRKTVLESAERNFRLLDHSVNRHLFNGYSVLDSTLLDPGYSSLENRHRSCLPGAESPADTFG